MRFKKNLFKSAILLLFSAFWLTVLFASPKTETKEELVICDVHTNNPRIVKNDGEIEFADYVRIKNLGDKTVDLSGRFLSDSKKDLQKYPLDGYIIEAGRSVMIKLDPSWNFALNKSGSENVYLSDREGNILFVYKSSMKPEKPRVSAYSGFYRAPFYIRITGSKDSRIYYSIDGNEPDETSILYNDPIYVYDRSDEPNSVVNAENIVRSSIDDRYEEELAIPPIVSPVDKAFIVRAVAIDRYGNKSDIVTREYFFCGDKYKNVISVVSDRDDLFGPQGILSVGDEYEEWSQTGGEGDAPEPNFMKKGRDWEVPADFDFFKNGRLVLSQKCGLRLQGRTTREKRIKNFQLRSRKRYSGSSVFEYDFFEDEPFRSRGITLDDSFRESLFLAIVDKEKIISQKTTERIALFINGEFWNNIYIHQRLDEQYFYDHFSISPDNLIVLNESFPEIYPGGVEEYEKVRNYYLAIDEFVRENDMKLSSNYEKLQTMMDMDSYIDYLAINTWVGCNDWCEYENDMYYRVEKPYDNAYGDGRFRWILHDGDNVFNREVSLATPGRISEDGLYSGLLVNSEFRKSLSERIETLGKTTFSDKNLNRVFSDERWDEPEKEEIIDFFRTRKDTMNDFVQNIDNLVNEK